MNSNGGSFGVTNILMMGVFFVAIYFLLIRPNAKKRKQEEEMRRALKVGDEITTIGGIVGRIVSIKEGADTFVIETGVDRSKIRIKRWAIAGCSNEREAANTVKPNDETTPSETEAKTQA